LSDAYQITNEKIHKAIECRFSGTTCCGVLVNGRHLILANVGDSRAVIVNDKGVVR
jgi:serine/threonine protein phosphatase PrpC